MQSNRVISLSLKPSVAAVMITRKCVHSCPHCLIHRKISEDLPADYWIEVGKKLHDKWDIHVNLYGGEPLCHLGFDDIIREYSSYGINYSMNTCSRPLSIKRAKRLVSYGLSNWTASVDSLVDLRSFDGIKALDLFRKLGVKDLMIEAVMYPEYTKRTLDVVYYAMDNGYWISVSAQSYGMGPQYDAFPAGVPKWSSFDLEIIKRTAKLLKDYKLSHCPTEYLDLLHTPAFLYQKLRVCNGSMVVFNADFDGSMRICRDIAGDRVRKWGALEAIDKYEDFHKDWMLDFGKQCMGCAWGCPYFSRNRTEEIKHERI